MDSTIVKIHFDGDFDIFFREMHAIIKSFIKQNKKMIISTQNQKFKYDMMNMFMILSSHFDKMAHFASERKQ